MSSKLKFLIASALIAQMGAVNFLELLRRNHKGAVGGDLPTFPTGPGGSVAYDDVPMEPQVSPAQAQVGAAGGEAGRADGADSAAAPQAQPGKSGEEVKKLDEQGQSPQADAAAAVQSEPQGAKAGEAADLAQGGAAAGSDHGAQAESDVAALQSQLIPDAQDAAAMKEKHRKDAVALAETIAEYQALLHVISAEMASGFVNELVQVRKEMIAEIEALQQQEATPTGAAAVEAAIEGLQLQLESATDTLSKISTAVEGQATDSSSTSTMPVDPSSPADATGGEPAASSSSPAVNNTQSAAQSANTSGQSANTSGQSANTSAQSANTSAQSANTSGDSPDPVQSADLIKVATNIQRVWRGYKTRKELKPAAAAQPPLPAQSAASQADLDQLKADNAAELKKVKEDGDAKALGWGLGLGLGLPAVFAVATAVLVKMNYVVFTFTAAPAGTVAAVV